MIPLTPLEQDILGDMAGDAHGVGELVGFIRAANPYYTNSEIFAALHALLARWIDRGWLRLHGASHSRTGLNDVGDLLPYLDRLGSDAMDPESDLPLPALDLTDQAFVDITWLRGAV